MTKDFSSYRSFRHILQWEDFEQVWDLLLSRHQDSCLYSSHEVAIASIKALNNPLPYWPTAWVGYENNVRKHGFLVLKLTMRLRTELECCYVFYSGTISIK